MKTHISSFHALWWTEKKKSQTEHLSQYMYLSGFRDVTILNGKVTKKKSHTNNMWQLFLLFLFWKECHTSNILKIKHIALFVTFVTFFWKNSTCDFPKNDERKMTLTKWYKKSRDNNTSIYLGTIGTKGTSKPHLFRKGIFFIRCFSGISILHSRTFSKI